MNKKQRLEEERSEARTWLGLWVLISISGLMFCCFAIAALMRPHNANEWFYWAWAIASVAVAVIGALGAFSFIRDLRVINEEIGGFIE